MIFPMFATPMFAGMCHGSYLAAMKGVWEACALADIPNIFYSPCDSLIPRARNNCVAEVLRLRAAGSPITHLFFIDSDIGGFTPDDMAAMWQADLPIVVGAYPLKAPGIPPFCFNAIDPPAMKGTGTHHFVQLKNAGTGFMCIRTDVLETLADKCPERRYWEGRNEAKYDLFGTGIDPCPSDIDHPGYLSEDYFFCALAERYGFTTWLYRECSPLTHTGQKIFSRDVKQIIHILGDTP